MKSDEYIWLQICINAEQHKRALRVLAGAMKRQITASAKRKGWAGG